MVAATKQMQAAAGERHRQRAADRSRTNSLAKRDVGDIPPVQDWDRRLLAEVSFRAFCESYGRATFSLGWSQDHLVAIEKIEATVVHRLRFALAMPRGQGKTSLCKWALLWAVLTGQHRYVVVLAATVPLAIKLLKGIKTILETSELLRADFPEALHAIAHLEGESRAAKGQHHHGRKTHAQWSTRLIAFPCIEGSPSSGAVIEAVSLLGSSRGLQFDTPDGETIRPTLVMGDDPQTDASAKSVTATQKRRDTLRGTIEGLVGAGESIGILVPCTVIAANDLAEQLLCRELSPEWQGERFSMVLRWPDDTALWEENLRLYAKSVANGGHGEEADAHYRANRARMDAGAVVSWPDRFDPKRETSAIQAAFYLRHRVKDKFEPEYQNQPPQLGGAALVRVDVHGLADRIVAIPRGVVPADAEALTAFIDVQHQLLFWMVVAWRTGLGGHVVAYGAWPDQGRASFTKQNARRLYGKALPGKTWKANLRFAMEECTDFLLGRSWAREGGGEARIQRAGIDVGDGKASDALWKFAFESKHRDRLQPCKGIGMRARDIPFGERKPKPGVRTGHHWQLNRPPRRPGPQLNVDTNRHKSETTAGLTSPKGERAAITVHDGQLHDHECLFSHLAAEAPRLDESGGSTLECWTNPPGRDNDWFDCLVNSRAIASSIGIRADDDMVPARSTPRSKRSRPRGRTTVKR